MNPDNGYSSQKPKCKESRMSCILFEKQKCGGTSALPDSCVRNAPPGSTHIFANSGSSSPLWWPQAAIWLPWVLWNELPLQRAEERSHMNRGWEMHREMPEECTRNARSLQHVTVRHHATKSWKDPASRKSADPGGVGVWECFYGNASKHSQEQPHHTDRTGRCQDKPDSHAIDGLGNGFLT